jgi:MFS family permease
MKIVKILPGEMPKLAWFTILAMLVQGGMALGLSSTDALFLGELGAEKLPIIYLLLPVAMLIFTPISSYLQARFSIEKVIRGKLLILLTGALLIGIALGLYGEHPHFAYGIYAIKLFTAIWFIGIYTIFWNYVDAYFSISEGKRLYGYINAGASLGIILAGSFLAKFSEQLSLSIIFYAWSIVSFAAILVSFKIGSQLQKLEFDNEESSGGLYEVLTLTAKATSKSKYALFTALLYFALPLLSTFNEYLCFSALSQQGDKEQIAALFGQLYGYANVLNLIISLSLFNFLVARIGVRNIVLIQPIVYFAAFFWYFADYSMAAAFFGFFAYNTLLTSVDNNNANFLFNALPAHGKRQIRTFIEGMGEPIAIAISGYLLLIALKDVNLSSLALAGIGGALMVFLIAYVINQLYVGGLMQNLRLGWIDITQSSEIPPDSLSRKEFAILKKQIHSNDPDTALAGIYLLQKTNQSMAAEEFCRMLPSIPPDYHAKAISLLEDFLVSGDLEIRSRLQDSLLKFDPQSIEWSYSHVRPHGLVVPRKETTAQSQQLIKRAATTHQPPTASATLTVLETPQEPNSGTRHSLTSEAHIQSLALSGKRENIRHLIPYIEQTSTRSQGLRAMANLVDAGMPTVASAVVKRAAKADELQIQLIFKILGKIRDAKSVGQLIQSRSDFTQQEKRDITSLIIGIGPRSVPVLIGLMQSPKADYAARSLALQSLAKLEYAQVESIWETLVAEEIVRAQAHRSDALKLPDTPSYPGLQLLKRAHEGLERRGLEWILELLSMAGRIPNHALLLNSLNSPSKKERANGVETIIEGAGIRFFKTIEPFLDTYLKPVSLSQAPAAQTNQDRPDLKKIEEDLNSPSPVVAKAATYAVYNEEFGLTRDILWSVLEKRDVETVHCTLTDLLVSENAQTHFADVEKLILLCKVTLFTPLQSSELHSILNYFEVRTFAPDDPLPNTALSFNATPDISLVFADGTIKAFPPGTVWGWNSIWSNNSDAFQPPRVDRQSLWLTLSRENFERAIRVYPKLGLSLLSAHH